MGQPHTAYIYIYYILKILQCNHTVHLHTKHKEMNCEHFQSLDKGMIWGPVMVIIKLSLITPAERGHNSQAENRGVFVGGQHHDTAGKIN